MKNLPLNSLRAFAVVYMTGGVRPAARKLLVSHSSISRHIKELEKWVGTPLLKSREKYRQLRFTVQGETLGKAALENLEAIQRTVVALREAHRSNAVIISTTASVAVRWLLPRLFDLQTAHPGIEISVLTEQAVGSPSDHGADFSIRMGSGPWKGVESVPLMDDFLFPVVHPRLWDKVGRKPSQDIFEKFSLLHDRDPTASWNRWFETFPMPLLDLRPGPRFSSSDLVLRAASRGLGIALARGQLASDDINSGALVRPFGEDQILLKDAYWIITSKKKSLKKAAKVVSSWLLDQGKVTFFSQGQAEEEGRPLL